MPLQTGILSSHSRSFDFLNRLTDIIIMGVTLLMCHALDGRQWGIASTLLFLFGLVYFQLTASLGNIYSSQRGLSTREHLGNVLLALLGAFALITMTAGLSNRLHGLADRLFLLNWLISSALLLAGWRLLLRQLLSLARKSGFNTRTVGIAGRNRLGQSLAKKLELNPWMGLKLAGMYDHCPGIGMAYASAEDDMQLKGDFSQLVEDARSGLLDHVYIALPMKEEERIAQLVNDLSDATATVFIIPDVFTFELLNSRQTNIDGIPAISIYDSPFSFSDTVIKRGFDIFGSLAILAVIAIPMLFIAIAVKTTSPGPVIFRQHRYGLDGKPINVWKFRTMTTQENGAVVRQATRNDSRLTRIGGFLRRTSLDELPQFINVLQGGMSIVGPRPHAVAHNEEYRKLIKGYMLRHKVKPGITGWAQINGWRGETDTLDKMEKRVEFDLAYIRNWNIWLDVKIVFLTIFKGFLGKQAY